MRASLLAAAATFALAAPSAAFAQAAAVDDSEAAISELSEQLSDPVFQDQMSAVASIFISSLLELEIGQFAAAVDEATGGEGPEIDPDARIRDIAPEAEELPDKVADNLPKAMNAMSAMSSGMADMLPALQAMADRMKDAFEEADLARETDAF
ncbi:hypothetical protein [Erythrobacter sp. YT30]|uniref:hypothetical protein n=1 Tax=Erythrobacter sp. YT30 TaxID=1735012 RepID=UPI00076C1BDF|nr:hypothetical protein [Erythrobacter sp. YT30]KWV91713.1 hypothetical protein AUC45_10930 [Erythrobacter sp. YT30]